MPHTPARAHHAKTVDEAEIAKFSAMADAWWDPKGDFAPLHRMQPLRIDYIKQMAETYFEHGLKSLKLLDVGCGGGLLAEPMTRLGAKVTGIDASEKNIKIAGLHAKENGLEIDYRHQDVEALATESPQYDMILALEIVEHVADVAAFMQALRGCLRQGGLLIMSTLNRTAKSYALAIVGAEYLLRWLPRGTHDWHRFIRPSELAAYGEEAGLTPIHSTGMVMNPLNFKWRLDDRDLSVNYLMGFTLKA